MRTLSTKKLALAISTALLAPNVTAMEMDADQFSVDLYGFVQLNAAFDINHDISQDTEEGSFTKLYSQKDTSNGSFEADANESLIGVIVEHQNGVKAVVEGDFFNNNLRLRKAYGEYGNWLIGQTWSNYNTFVGLTPTLDFDGPTGLAGVQDRTAQIRYTHGNFSLSVEDNYDVPNEIILSTASNAAQVTQKNTIPAFTARYEDTSGAMLSYAVGAVIQQVSYDNNLTDDSKLGGAAFAAFDLSVTENIILRATANYSSGANNYLYRSSGISAYEQAPVASPTLKTIDGYGGTVGLSIGNVLDGEFNVVWGMTSLDVDSAVAAGTATADAAGVPYDKTRSNVFLNYMWYPVDSVMLGVEYGFYSLKTIGGERAEANRFMFSGQYSF